MHRCLSILEVQRAIFHEVHDQPNGRATLARVARTCRALHNVALDVLWAELDSFVHLIQCLPRGLWKIEPEDKKLTFQRPMSLKDWGVFLSNTDRVQCLALGDDVVFALSNPPTYGPLIPHLRELHWDRPNKKYASLLRLLLTPSLVTLSLSNCALRYPEVSILTSIGNVCPSLTSLNITSHKPFANILDTRGRKILSEALLRLHLLEAVSCPTLDEAAIIHLSGLPFLTSLSLELQLDFKLEKVRPYVAPPTFAFLSSLTLHAHELSMVTSLLELMRFKPKLVTFVVASTPTIDALRLFFLALASACDSDQLIHITLTTSNERQPDAPSNQVTLSTFRPLLSFPNIRLFEFDVQCDVALDDDAIASLAKHWPDLHVISLNARSGWGISSRVTHRGLITLLERCPQLNNFALAIDFYDVDVSHEHVSDAERFGDGVCNARCQVANFVTSFIMFPITIAMFLSDVCPKLEGVESAWDLGMTWMDVDRDEADEYREKWEEVGNLLPAFSTARRQSVNWALKKAKEERDAPA